MKEFTVKLTVEELSNVLQGFSVAIETREDSRESILPEKVRVIIGKAPIAIL